MCFGQQRRTSWVGKRILDRGEASLVVIGSPPPGRRHPRRTSSGPRPLRRQRGDPRVRRPEQVRGRRGGGDQTRRRGMPLSIPTPSVTRCRGAGGYRPQCRVRADRSDCDRAFLAPAQATKSPGLGRLGCSFGIVSKAIGAVVQRRHGTGLAVGLGIGAAASDTIALPMLSTTARERSSWPAYPPSRHRVGRGGERRALLIDPLRDRPAELSKRARITSA